MIKRLASYLVVFAILLAGFVPAGWMPATGTDGKVLLVICSDGGVQERWVDLGGETPPTEQMEDRSCPFAAVATAAVLPDAAALPGSDHTTAARWPHEAFTHHSAGFYWQYDARGPPAVS